MSIWYILALRSCGRGHTIPLNANDRISAQFYELSSVPQTTFLLGNNLGEDGAAALSAALPHLTLLQSIDLFGTLFHASVVQ